jgi:D-arabinose 1-dehydrogenase-like Zn-dependent alcohol dehydrogenase
VFTIGFISGSRVTADLMPIIVKGLRVQGNNTGSVSDLRAAIEVVEQQRIVPVVDAEFEISDVQSAYRHMQRAGHFGKVAIKHP